MKFIYILVCSIVALTSCTYNVKNKKEESPISQNKSGYYCPMKCEGEKTYAVAGKCPACDMDLEKVGGDGMQHTYQCPMHKEVTSNNKGMCATCGSELVEVK